MRVLLIGLLLSLPSIAHAECSGTVTSTTTYTATIRLSKVCKPTKGATVTVTTAPTVTYVTAGGDLRTALATAVAGDVIELQAGATYPSLVLPVHAGDVDITIRTRGTLPDRRLTPADQPLLATIASTVATVPAIQTAPGAHHWRLEGIAITQTGGQTYELVTLGDGENADPARMPHHITLDRVRIFVADDVTQRRGVGVNGNDLAITRSDMRNIKEVGADSQAISGRQGERIIIADNYLEAAGENILFGGADPGIVDAVPSDIRIEGNTISKPLAWKGSLWSVKNSLELKNARRVTIRGNVIEHNWAAAQAGYTVVLTPRNQSGTCPWCTVEDVLIEGNLIRDVSSAFNVLGTDDEQPSQVMSRVTIRQNVIHASAARHGGEGRCVLIGGGPRDLTIDHNTCLVDGSAPIALYGSPMTGFVMSNNLITHNAYGLIGDDSGIGTVALQRYAPDAAFLNNVFGGGEGQTYPATTQLPSMATFTAQFVSYPENVALVPTSTWIGAGPDGKDLGADLSLVPQP